MLFKTIEITNVLPPKKNYISPNFSAVVIERTMLTTPKIVSTARIRSKFRLIILTKCDCMTTIAQITVGIVALLQIPK